MKDLEHHVNQLLTQAVHDLRDALVALAKGVEELREPTLIYLREIDKWEAKREQQS